MKYRAINSKTKMIKSSPKQWVFRRPTKRRTLLRKPQPDRSASVVKKGAAIISVQPGRSTTPLPSTIKVVSSRPQKLQRIKYWISKWDLKALNSKATCSKHTYSVSNCCKPTRWMHRSRGHRKSSGILPKTKTCNFSSLSSFPLMCRHWKLKRTSRLCCRRKLLSQRTITHRICWTSVNDRKKWRQAKCSTSPQQAKWARSLLTQRGN